MKALFKVTIRKESEGMAFTSENVIAGDAIEAASKAATAVGKMFKSEKGLYVSDVELLGEVTVG